MPPNAAQLVGITGELAGRVFPVRERLVIGRAETADLQIAHLEVSRRHCEIERVGDGFVVRDLGSRSGTRLNDSPVQSASAPISSGDLLAVGPQVLRFEIRPVERPAGAEPGTASVSLGELPDQMTLREIPLADFDLARQVDAVTEQSARTRLRRHLEVVHQFAEAIQTTLDTRALIERVLDELFRVLHRMDAGVVFLRDAATGQLAPAATRRRRDEPGPVGCSSTVLRFVETQRRAVLNADISQDERFRDAASVRMGAMRTHMCVPLVVREEVVGAVYLVAEGAEQPAGVEQPTTGFEADDLMLLSALSGTAAVCVKNAALAEEAQRNARLSAGLRRYVSADVTRRLIDQGVGGALGARTHDGIAMFCDLVGFTTLSEQLAPDEMARLLNRYFRRALERVFARGGSVNKFGGDSFLAVWGAIDPAPADLNTAVLAALEIQNDTFRLSAELAADGFAPIQLTIGISRGRFFAGDIGAEDRMEFTVIGDPVNVAARVQALAHGGQVLTTLGSLGAARSEMSLLVYPDIPIRGRTAGVTIAAVRSIRTDETAGGDRLVASIPVEIPSSNSRSLVVGAMLGDPLELELLSDQMLLAGQEYELTPATPEWEGRRPPAQAACVTAVAEQGLCSARLHLTRQTDELSAMLQPGSARTATRPLRKKS
jgi:adenylate cyclase